VAVLPHEKGKVSYIPPHDFDNGPNTPHPRARKAEPNAAHIIIAALSVKETLRQICPNAESFTLVTQNVDGLSRRALDQLTSTLASKKTFEKVTPEPQSVIEMHGRLFDTLCTQCGHREPNHDSPICAALEGTEVIVEKQEQEPDIPLSDLPRCTQPDCGGLLRPGWNLTLFIGYATGN
jgi:NAD-dependent deacetylase sirtuin 5